MLTSPYSTNEIEVIDADGHVIEPPDLWGSHYMPADYRDKGPTISSADGRLHFPDGSDFPESPHVRTWWDAGTLGFARQAGAAPRYGDGRKGATDPHGRIDDLDVDGIDAVALYPTVGLITCFAQDPGLASAMCRAYNRWLADWCGMYPGRLIGVAMLPVQSVAHAVEELRFARNKLGLRAAFLFPQVYEGRTIHSCEWDLLWAEAESLDCPIALHGVGAWPTPQIGAERFTDDSCPAWAYHVVVHPFEQQLAFVGLMLSGVFDRFPALRIAFLESGGGWVAPLLERLERHHKQSDAWSRWAKKHGTREVDLASRRSPREYFDRNCWISFEPIERTLGLLAPTFQ